MAIPAIPQGLSITQGNVQVFLTWNTVAGATSYDIQRSTDNITFASIATPAIPQYLDTSVLPNTQYYYQVASVNGSGTSSYTISQGVVPTIAGQMTLGQLRLAAQQRADRVNSNFISTSEWNSYINQSYFELYDLLTTTFEDYYIATPVYFNTNGGTYIYALPDGVTFFNDVLGTPFVPKPFYKLRGVDLALQTSNNAFVTINPFNFINRNTFVYPNTASTIYGVFNLQYKLLGNQIEFIPTPSAGQTIRLWYIPRMSQLVTDVDVADGVSGWTEYIITDVAIKALQKEESDVSVLMAQKMALLKRIEETSMNRDAGSPATISNSRKADGSWGSGPGGWGGYGPVGGW